MNRFEEEKFVEVYNLIFIADQFLEAGMVSAAVETYGKVENAYNKLPETSKQKLHSYVIDLFSRIKDIRMTPEDERFADAGDVRRFVFQDGSIMTSLLHLLYVTEKMPQITWQCHVNYTKNDVLEWIRYSLEEKRLANLLDGITDIKTFRDIVFKDLMMRAEGKISLQENYSNF